MAFEVLDTNVLVIANGQDSPDLECQLACVQLLDTVRLQGEVVLDLDGFVLKEYADNLDQSKPMKTGAAFLIALFNYSIPQRRISIQDHAERVYAAFPSDPALAEFDRSDRKFVALALTLKPHRLCEACDSDFWEYRAILAHHGVNLNFLCPKLFATQSGK